MAFLRNIDPDWIYLCLILMVFGVIFLRKAILSRKQKADTVPAGMDSEEAAAVPVPAAPAAAPAPGSAGRIKMHNVPPKTCAMLMAIVANKMGKPLNELRFISIKEVN